MVPQVCISLYALHIHVHVGGSVHLPPPIADMVEGFGISEHTEGDYFLYSIVLALLHILFYYCRIW